ncbi:hypothetical protein PV371_33155 [Streptomyces sp. TX20-6-3]|uniref:hypothetical protein n=1 Tax=Streptomyces sp. TX20-6-3 TaxID=3028705 RepID=UPI0029BD5F10|nr:hypothetical protein [Streptomyces sp. TX20-6-3]MDX2564474.1 hypothetical protein [Streptomyces sp. TX20-6-3]
MTAVKWSTPSGKPETEVAGRIRTCRPAIRETDGGLASDRAGEEEGDAEPQIVRGDD